MQTKARPGAAFRLKGTAYRWGDEHAQHMASVTLAAANIAASIRKNLAKAGPLTDAQRAELCGLLGGE